MFTRMLGRTVRYPTLWERAPELLSEKGILIRDCSNYRGLGGGWYRIAVRTHEENEQLLAAMREVCQ
jgi:histidinol-phosphate/aromatic aminotransferase/cobyric acid decarboxylase-like protein